MSEQKWCYALKDGKPSRPKCEYSLYFLFLTGQISQKTILFDNEEMISGETCTTYADILSGFSSNTDRHPESFSGVSRIEYSSVKKLVEPKTAKRKLPNKPQPEDEKHKAVNLIKPSKASFYQKNKKFQPLLIRSIKNRRLKLNKAEKEAEINQDLPQSNFSGLLLLVLSLPMWIFCVLKGALLEAIVFQSVLSLVFLPFLCGLKANKYIFVSISLATLVLVIGINFPQIAFPASILLLFLLVGYAGLQFSIIIPSFAVVTASLYIATDVATKILCFLFLAAFIFIIIAMPVFLELWTWRKLLERLFYISSIVFLITAVCFFVWRISGT